MPQLTINGTTITGVREARVEIFHRNPNAPDPVPTMQFNVTLRLQNADLLPKWALSKQSPERFKKVELQIQNAEKTTAHKWTLLNGFIANYNEVEHPEDTPGKTGEAGMYLNLIIRGHMPESADYTGENVLTVAAGAAPKTAG